MRVEVAWDDSSFGFSQLGGDLRASFAFPEPQFVIRARREWIFRRPTFHVIDLNLSQVIIRSGDHHFLVLRGISYVLNIKRRTYLLEQERVERNFGIKVHSK
jgi:hypothetical protein